ncbi:alpha-L-rhamnosidase N-terminal domain-containing protein [Paraflavitalea sp. CAU 1676]|uniref:alpha-L-rhamnosidase-related protein n=1 Tax=Paraflavitalea sp. CAU 1676 TaxID=3032598 RepID=UPI0023DB0D32|nr:alpha-L-rhamnosidase N-terminal domain-containing protein [Paraflavitalea sp. CAU 1676]MDF2188118.1 alpha-L-rhamnosidase N-terminal domain-containing protein [Paraflavitalea sp. CAU 1676]
MKIPAILLLFICSFANARQTAINPALLKDQWKASWITCPDIAGRAYGVYHFRKTFQVTARPARFVVHVSADNRYRLFVNGKAVCNGPARGDLYNWYYETIDIAPFLQAGANTIAAQVWNMGEHAAVAQISNQTAFLLQGDAEQEQVINTNRSWKVSQNKAYYPCSLDNGPRLHTYMVIGPGDSVVAAQYPWQWEGAGYNDGAWTTATTITSPVPVGYGTDNLWTLAPRNIPLMEEKQQRIPSVRRSAGIEASGAFLGGNQPLMIPAHQTVSILLDQTYNTVAYPELVLSRGKGARVKLTYAEALFGPGGKANRNEIEGKQIQGNFDVFETDGGEKRLFRPLWLRTYRYLQLDITTKEEPLVLDDLYGMYTGYPFEAKASFSSNDASLQEIWKVGWRTARLCAGETYYDCPYYEQLQYEGDTRIQSLISLYVAGDDRLMRKALLDFYYSRVPEGLTQGRYPSNRLQVIPPFSLYWVSMVYDYFMHRRDEAFLGQFLTGVEGVLNWYEKHIDNSRQMLGPMKWWNFTDWNHAFPMGVPDGATDGNSSILTLQYVYTLRQAAELFTYFKKPVQAARYTKTAADLARGTFQACFDTSRQLMANTPARNTFSQHAGIMGVLTGAVPAQQQQAVMNKVLYDKSLSQATFYYRFYLTLALKKAGMGQLYYSQLKPWRDMLTNGLTTFAENPDPTRSDCHAWSASPNYDFLATICGITPGEPGFKKVQVMPQLGELQQVSGRMPHPDGEIVVMVQRKGNKGVHATVILPGTLTGTFIWNGIKKTLHAGSQEIDL